MHGSIHPKLTFDLAKPGCKGNRLLLICRLAVNDVLHFFEYRFDLGCINLTALGYELSELT
jgi:hypothetical protein